MADSIFTKIIKGEIPCHKVYEDDKVIAFLDIAPYSYGHTLVVPKRQIEHFWDLDSDLYEYVMEIAKKVAQRQRNILKVPRVGMVVDGYGLPEHTHVHIFPLYENLEKAIEHKVDKPTNEQLAEMAKKLKF